MRFKMLTVFLCVVLVTSKFSLTRTSPIDCDLQKHGNDYINVKYHISSYDKDIKLAPSASKQDVTLDDITREMTAMLEQLEPKDCPKTNHHRHHEHKRLISARQPYFYYTTLTKTIIVGKIIEDPIDAEADRPTGTKSNNTIGIKQNITTIDTLVTETDKIVDITTDLILDTSTDTVIDATTDVFMDTSDYTMLDTTTDNDLDYETTTSSIMDLNTEVSTPTPVADCKLSSETGYLYFPITGSCYKPYKEHQTWSEARSKCLSEGADLLVINDEFEDKVIKNIINNFLLPQHEYYKWFWVGITKDENDVFHSIYGDNMNEIYNVWKYKHFRKCVAVYVNGQLEDAPCDYTYGFVCEKTSDLILDINTEDSPAPVPQPGETESISMIDCTPESGYSYFPNTGSCYKPYKEHQTWSEAQSKCQSEGADLLVINTEFEVKVIKNIINNFLLPQHEYFRWFWVGITKDDYGVLRSIHGDNMNELYNVWKYRHFQKCVAIYMNGQLEDAPCDYTYGFICEKSFGIVIKIQDFQ